MAKKSFAKRALALMLALGMTFSVVACGGSKDNSGDSDRKDANSIVEDNKATDTAQDETEVEVTKKTEYPLTITTYGTDGKELTTVYEKAPEKVLAVYQGCIETMLALGLEDHLVATAGLDNEVPDDQKAAFSKVEYLDEFTPSLETVTMLEPDLIFSWGSLFKEKTLGDAKGWVDKGTNIYMNTNTHPKDGDTPYAKTLENEYNDILNIGKIFDVQDKAEAIVNNMKETIENTKAAVADISEKPDVLILEYSKDTFSNYGASTLGGDMVTQLGGNLASPDGGSMGKEDLISVNPDVIFVVYMPYTGDDPEEVKQKNLDYILKDETLASLDAVKNNRVVPIMLSEMYASATRTQDGIEIFAKGLYPDLNLGE